MLSATALVGAGTGVDIAAGQGDAETVDVPSGVAAPGSQDYLFATRTAPPVSRSDARLLVGADRLQAIETKAAETVHARRGREARQAARKRPQHLRAQNAREADQWRPPLTTYNITATFGQAELVVVDRAHRRGPGRGDRDTGASGRTWDGYLRGLRRFRMRNKIVVQHDDGTETWYCDLSEIDVSTGTRVTSATVIGLVGATGNVTETTCTSSSGPRAAGDRSTRWLDSWHAESDSDSPREPRHRLPPHAVPTMMRRLHLPERPSGGRNQPRADSRLRLAVVGEHAPNT